MHDSAMLLCDVLCCIVSQDRSTMHHVLSVALVKVAVIVLLTACPSHDFRLMRPTKSLRMEAYWVCAQKKVGLRHKANNKSMFCYTYPSFTILIHMMNEMVTGFNLYMLLVYVSLQC